MELNHVAGGKLFTQQSHKEGYRLEKVPSFYRYLGRLFKVLDKDHSDWYSMVSDLIDDQHVDQFEKDYILIIFLVSKHHFD